MTHIKKLFVISILCVSTVVVANEPQEFELCQGIGHRVPYKEAVKAERKGEKQDAFVMYCELGKIGDYRAQYHLSLMYHQGIPQFIESNAFIAYVWASVSNSYNKTVK